MRNARLARTAAVLVAATLALTVLAGCTPAAPAARPQPAASAEPAATFPITVTDDAGRSVTLRAAARRVVSLAPANTEIVDGLGEFDRLVGVTTYDDYPAAVSRIAKVGDFTAPNLEAIAMARPDLILVTGGVQADVVGKLEGLGAAVLVVDPTDVDGVYGGITLVAAAMGVPAKGAELVDGMKRDLAEIERRVGGSKPVTCFVEIGWNPLFTAGPGTLIGDLVTRAGGTNVVVEQGYVGYSAEQLLKDQPGVYLGTKSSIGDVATIGQRPGYMSLSAVTSGRVGVLDDNLVSRPGPRVVEGVLEIARALHPDSF
jgi:iron complex transport system substrate-binding protein